MGIYSKQQLLSELIDRTELISSSVQYFLRLNDEQLNARPAPGKWSIAAIFEHLNITNAIYIRSILKKLQRAGDVTGDTFKSGWLGDWAYEKMMPRPDGTVFKMKTPAFLHPPNHLLDGHDVLNRFLQQQDMIHDILTHARSKDLQRIKVPFSFTKLLSLRLGDNLRFLIAHSERHLLQAQRATEAILNVEL